MALCQKEYYTDAKQGNDSSANGTKEYPFKTLTRALSSLEGNAAIIYLRKEQTFSDLSSKIEISFNLTIRYVVSLQTERIIMTRCWMDEGIPLLPKSYPSILLNSSNISFLVTANLVFDGIHLHKPENVSVSTFINISSNAKLFLKVINLSIQSLWFRNPNLEFWDQQFFFTRTRTFDLRWIWVLSFQGKRSV